MSTTNLTLPLAQDKVLAYLENLPGWSFKDGAIEKTYEFGSFREAMSFMLRVAFEAEVMNHHPEWTNIYSRIQVRLRTHEADDKVTEKDVQLARHMEKICWLD